MRGLTTKLLLVAAVAWAGAAAAAPESLRPITTNESAVAVKVTPKTLTGSVWEFEVAFDTHSQELKDDLVKSATLMAADGSPVGPLEWKGAQPGGHHRAGLLRFAALKPIPEKIELRISRAGEPKPRIYVWSSPLAASRQ